MIVFAALLIIVLVGGLAGLTFWKIKSTDPKNVDTSLKNDVSIAKDFLIFKDIKDRAIDLGGHQYRAIIECSSINYYLKTNSEQDLTEYSYQRFLNTLNHPITFFLQTKEIDNTKMLKKLSEDMNETVVKYPNLENYANQYYKDMETLYETYGNGKKKDKYIIIPFDGAIELTNLNEEEKYIESLKELNVRCNLIIESLAAVGIIGERLETTQLVDLIYSAYHKDSASQIENIINGEFTSMIVEGEEKLSQATPDGILDWILYETSMRVRTEVADSNRTPEDIKKRAYLAMEEIEKIRTNIGGAYKTTYVDTSQFQSLNNKNKEE